MKKVATTVMILDRTSTRQMTRRLIRVGATRVGQEQAGGQKPKQNVRLDALGLVVPDWTDPDVGFVNAGQVHVNAVAAEGAACSALPSRAATARVI